MSKWGITDLQIATIDAIVTTFESGQPSNYGAVARDPNDAGGLSYGKHQASLTRGKLFELVSAYCALPEAQCAVEFQTYLPQIKAGDRALDSNKTLYSLLKKASDDPAMQQAQDEYFSQNFMQPALTEWQRLGFKTALAAAVVYDSFINSGSLNMLNATVAKYGQPSSGSEKEWIAGYVATRKDWLTRRYPANAIRMTTFEGILRDQNWDLKLPIRVMRGANVYYPLTAYDLGVHLFASTVRRLGREGFGVARMGDTTLANARDKFVQASLNALQYPVGVADGFFGTTTVAQVKAFQKACGLAPTGEVDGRCFDKLCSELEEKGTTGAGSAVATDHGLVELPPEKRTSTTASKTGAGIAVGAAGVAGVAGTVAGTGDDPSMAGGTTTDATQAITVADGASSAAAAPTSGAPDAAGPVTAGAAAAAIVAPASAPGADHAAQSQTASIQTSSGQASSGQTSSGQTSSGQTSSGQAKSGPTESQTSEATTSGTLVEHQLTLPGGIKVSESVLALTTAALFVGAIVLFAHGRRRSY